MGLMPQDRPNYGYRMGIYCRKARCPHRRMNPEFIQGLELEKHQIERSSLGFDSPLVSPDGKSGISAVKTTETTPTIAFMTLAPEMVYFPPFSFALSEPTSHASVCHIRGFAPSSS